MSIDLNYWIGEGIGRRGVDDRIPPLDYTTCSVCVSVWGLSKKTNKERAKATTTNRSFSIWLVYLCTLNQSKYWEDRKVISIESLMCLLSDDVWWTCSTPPGAVWLLGPSSNNPWSLTMPCLILGLRFCLCSRRDVEKMPPFASQWWVYGGHRSFQRLYIERLRIRSPRLWGQ